MNRAQRRLHGFRDRPSGQFLGELQRRGLNRTYQEQLRSQMEREANGAPVDPEVAARMTAPKETEQLFQVMVPDKVTGKAFQASPMMSEQACGVIAETINRQVIAGQRKNWGMAEVIPLQRIEGVI
jgi:hypothetical protein